MDLDGAIVKQVKQLQRRTRRGVFPWEVQVWLGAQDKGLWRCEWSIRRRMGQMADSRRLYVIDWDACVGLSLGRIGGAGARQGYRCVETKLPRFRQPERRQRETVMRRAA